MVLNLPVLVNVVGNILLFALVFGMSATVDVNHLQTQVKNVKAISTGLAFQFIVLPFLGFLVVKTFDLSHPTGLTLLVVTSSPGGSYSNWWCSLFNADLALSVTMTAISTILSSAILPLNLFFYARWCYDEDVLSSIDWSVMSVALVVVILAITTGLYASYKLGSDKFKIRANHAGSAAGLLLVIFSFCMSNSNADSRVWNLEPEFYIAVSMPCFFALLLSNAITTVMSLWEPERVTVSIECAYQNVGIAASVAMSMFRGDDRAAAMAVPFFYGFIEGVFILIYCLGAWKAGWTKAPADVSFTTMIITNYEVLATEEHDERAHAVAAADKDMDDYYMIDYNDAKASEVQPV